MKVMRVTFQIIDSNGSVRLERQYEMPAEPSKHAVVPMLPQVARSQAQKFWEDAVRLGALAHR